MNNFYKDIYTGALFVTGMISFMSGEFILSSAVFAIAFIASNINMNHKRDSNEHLVCD
ncbi:MAG: hypothetical protein NTV00_02360 [Methylococcales bacterium]|nr:hypothetical protein [Methylococcales bacterium]